MSNKISEDFKNWACSFSGCDGGNYDAEIWLCGIEWGYEKATEKERENYYKKELPVEIKNGTIKPKDQFDWEDSLTYTYGWNFAKLYQAINGKAVDSYKEVKKLKGDELFKLNLYPIAFRHTGHELWNTYELNETTGFDSKYLFNTWCFFNRLPFFNELRKKHNPKLIICTGVNYLHSFLMSFGGENIGKLQTGEIKPISDQNKTKSGKGRTFYYIKVDKTLLVVIPFLGNAYGLNSNHLLQEMGEKIRKLMGNENDK